MDVKKVTLVSFTANILKEEFSFQQYIKTFPPVPSHELLGSAISKFETVLVMPHDDINCISTIRQALLDIEIEGDTEYLPFILDVDVYQNKFYDPKACDDMWDVYEEMRTKKNAIFFSTLTDEAMAPYV